MWVFYKTWCIHHCIYVFFFYHVRHFLSVFDHLVLVFYSDFTQVNGRIHPSIHSFPLSQFIHWIFYLNKISVRQNKTNTAQSPETVMSKNHQSKWAANIFSYFFFLVMMSRSYHTSCKFILIQHPAQRKTFNKRGPTLIRTKSGAVIGKLNWGDGILLIELAAREKRNCQFRTMSLCDIERLRRGKKVKRKKREVREAER